MLAGTTGFAPCAELDAINAFWDAGGDGRIVIVSDLTVLAMNVRARELVAQDDVVRISHGRLALADREAQATTSSALTRVYRRPTAFLAPSVRAGSPALILKAASARLADGRAVNALELRRMQRCSIIRLIQIARSHKLTPTEMRVLERMLRGLSVEAAAQSLGVATETAKTHLKRIYLKAGVTSRSALFELALRAAW